MAVVHVSGTGGGITSDRIPFVGFKIPEEITRMISAFNNASVDKSGFRILLTGVVAALEGKEVDRTTFDRVVKSNANVTEDTLLIMVSGLHRLLQLSLRLSQTSLKQEILKDDLIQLKFPQEFIPDVVSAVFGSRREFLLKNALETRPRLPKLDSFQWRVDVGISTSVLNRVLESTVMMQMTLSDGSVRTFETSLSKFHELRYNVACLLKEMEDLEKRTVLKIQD